MEFLVCNALDDIFGGCNSAVQALVKLLVHVVREINLARFEEESSAERERDVVEIVAVYVLFVLIIGVLGVAEIGLFDRAFLLNLDEVLIIVFDVVVRKKHFLFGVVGVLLVNERSLDAHVCGARPHVVLCIALFHLADVVGKFGYACRHLLILASRVFDEQSVLVDWDVFRFILVITRRSCVFCGVERACGVIIEHPVVSAVGRFVNARVDVLVRVDVACAGRDVGNVVISHCVFARDVIELGHADLGCVDSKRNLVIPQIEVDRDKLVARFERCDKPVCEIDRFVFAACVLEVEFGHSDQVIVFEFFNLFAVVDLSLSCVRIENVCAAVLQFDENFDFLYVVIACRACNDFLVVCFALDLGHFGLLHVCAVRILIIHALVLRADAAVLGDVEQVLGLGERVFEIFCEFLVFRRRFVKSRYTALELVHDHVCLCIGVSRVVGVKRNVGLILEFVRVELDSVLAHHE